ncbi:hypothetical protein MG293_019268 [Ovis ammon polii]|uniref:Uncharacterized protein n=1 Tax=Ovis ammon polii TaxID=230172 RepID=A0AAD4Y0D6_OVIAM|nr:hypothetical protein MG293_019268 [Ovis ammon polii]
MGYPSKDVVYTQNLSTKKGLVPFDFSVRKRSVSRFSFYIPDTPRLSGAGHERCPEAAGSSSPADLARLIEQKPFQGSTCAKRLQDIDPLPPLPLKPHVAAPGKDQSSGARPWGCGRSFPAARPGQHASVPAHAHASLLLARNIQYL